MAATRMCVTAVLVLCSSSRRPVRKAGAGPKPFSTIFREAVTGRVLQPVCSRAAAELFTPPLNMVAPEIACTPSASPPVAAPSSRSSPKGGDEQTISEKENARGDDSHEKIPDLGCAEGAATHFGCDCCTKRGAAGIESRASAVFVRRCQPHGHSLWWRRQRSKGQSLLHRE